MCRAGEAGGRISLHQVLVLLLLFLVLFLFLRLHLVLRLHLFGIHLHQDISNEININHPSSSERGVSSASLLSYFNTFAGYSL